MSAKNVEPVVENGTKIFFPLSKLKKSPKNARKTPHSEAAIEAWRRVSPPKASCKTLSSNQSWTRRAPQRGFISSPSVRAGGLPSFCG
jgi:ParB family transcriptional regulator, chromosome partitioning protein